MTAPSSLRQVIAALVAAYPWASIQPETVSVYETMLEDLDPVELQAATVEWIRTHPRFPAVSELVDVVMERRLALPGADEAWRAVERALTATEAYEECPTCEGRGWSSDTPDVDRPCPGCRGEGKLEVGRAKLWRDLPGPVRDAVDFIGGRSAFRSAEDTPLSVLRGQFVKAYDRSRERAVCAAALETAPAIEPPDPIRAIEAA